MILPELSIVVPFFNEEENLPTLLREIRTAVEPLERPYEVLLVDDGSTDGSLAVARGLARGDGRIRLLHIRRNSGLSAGLDAGFQAARGTVVVTLDADLQNDPADIPRLLADLDGCDVVCGVRQRRRDSWLRRLSSKIANRIRNWATGESVTDTGCTLRVYRRELLLRVPMFTGMHRFLPTLLKLAGAHIREVPVNHRPRLYGRPKYNIRNRIWVALVDLMAMRWIMRRWIDRRLVEEIASDRSGVEGTRSWTTTPSGSASGSSAKDSSPLASSFNG